MKLGKIVTLGKSSVNSVNNPCIVKVIKCGRLQWAKHVARMEEGRNAFKVLNGKSTGKDTSRKS